MAKNTTLFLTQKSVKTLANYAAGDTTTDKSILTIGSNGCVMYDVLIRSTSTSDNSFILKVNSNEVARFKVPLSAGNGTVASVNLASLVPLLYRRDNAGNSVIGFEATDSITVGATSTMPSGIVTFMTKSEDY